MKDYHVYFKSGVVIIVHADRVIYDSGKSPCRDMIFFYVGNELSVSMDVVDLSKISLEIRDDHVLDKLMESVI